MKRKVSLLFCIVLILSLSLTFFASCDLLTAQTPDGDSNGDSTDNTEKRIPVYQGMSITPVFFSSSASAYGNGKNEDGKDGFDYEKDNGNHNGHFKGDHEDKDDELDEEHPFPENGENENIEQEIKSSLEVVGSPVDIYYATPNEDIYINIHINNPDSFEIMSFTLNGKKYSSYMFEDGSDMETIILKYNVGEARGVIDYTIDAIKYVDGTEIKDVIIDGDKTVRAGVRVGGQVTTNVQNVDIDTNAISFDAFIKDNDSLAEIFGGVFKAVLYDGVSLIAQKDLETGANTVTFDGLKTNTVYQYSIVGYYDDLSGAGFGMNVLYTDAFITDSVVLFSDISLTQDGISFSFMWHEDHVSKSITAIKLYKDGELVNTLNGSVNEINGLLSNNVYTVIAEYENGGNTESIYLDFITATKTVPDFTITGTDKTQTSLGFDISVTDTDSVGTITSVKLIHGTDVTTLENTTSHVINNLLSNNEYTLKVTYTYDLNDGNGNKTIEKELTVKTEAKAAPVIVITNTDKTQTSLGFDISVTDTDSVGTITSVKLIHGTDVTTLENTTSHVINNLLSNNEYTLKVTYTYDLNDGNGNKTIEKELTVKTRAKAAPVFTVSNKVADVCSFTADYSITDVDDILISYKVELYKGNTLVSENEEKKIDFSALDVYTDYTVRITYTYDLNDGNGVQTATSDCSFKTLPYIDVIECSIANTSAVSEGETIFMAVKLDNPLNMTVESVVINGVTYGVTSASTQNKIFVEIVYQGQFDGGNTYLKIERINAKIGETELAVAPETELSDDVFINGKLELLGIDFVNESFESVDWVFPSDKLYVMITLDNPTGYNIDSVYGSNVCDGSYQENTFTDLIKLDDDHWCLEIDFRLWANGEPFYNTSSGTVGNIWWNMISLSYSNDYIQKSITPSTFTHTEIYRLASDEIRYVSTPDDLKNMNGKLYYELAGDIDLAGIEWHGESFEGIFDGKGYSIKNMSFVGTINNSEAYLGLFSRGYGYISNLNIENATIIAEITADNEGTYHAYCGGILALADGFVVIESCTVDKYSIFSVKNNCGDSNVGGLIGRAYDAAISDCTNSGSVSGTCAGGLIGYAGVATITSSTNSGSINGTYAGGLVGNAYSTMNITNCTNSGSISGNSTGGLIGYAGTYGYSDYTITISNSTNIGSISGGSAGGLICSSSNCTINITNSTNSGDVSGDYSAGGLICGAHWMANVTINNSANSGSISGQTAGGLVGGVFEATVNIINCTNSGSVTATASSTNSYGSGDAYAGGLVGDTIYGTVNITNSINSGSVTATASGSSAYAGGLVSGDNLLMCSNSYVNIFNSINCGIVSATASDSDAYAGGLIGWVYESTCPTIKNSYSPVSGNGSYNGEHCTVEQLNSKEFYTETLTWSEDVWDFSELDVLNGKVPTLK